MKRKVESYEYNTANIDYERLLVSFIKGIIKKPDIKS